MSSLLPMRSDPSPGGQDPRVVDLEGEDADQVFGALSSSTARRIVTALHEEPRTQSDLADAIDTTVQNVRYHLDNLEDAGLVEVVDTWYSSRGNEMKVYAPADAALIVSGDRGRASRLKTALSRIVGGTAVIGLASLLVQVAARRLGTPISLAGSGQAGGGAGAPPAPSPVEDGTDGDGGGGDGGDGAMGGGDASGESTQVADAPEAGETATTPTTAGGDGGAGTATETTAETVTRTTDVSATATPEPTATPTPEPTPGTTEAPTTATGTAGGPPKTGRAVTDGGVDYANETTEVAVRTTTTTVEAAASGGAEGLPPGLLFFLGGVSVLLVLVAVWYWSGS